MHSRLFGCLTILGAKRAELVQMFVPRSRDRIFRNERTQSTPMDPKLVFGAFRTIYVHSGPFGCHTKLCAKRAELVQKVVPRSRVGIFPNEHSRSTPLDPKLMFCCIFHTIWVHSGPFGCLTKLGAKQAELVQMFVPRSRDGIFRNERTQSTPLDTKLVFWCISYHLCAFGTI